MEAAKEAGEGGERRDRRREERSMVGQDVLNYYSPDPSIILKCATKFATKKRKMKCTIIAGLAAVAALSGSAHAFAPVSLPSSASSASASALSMAKYNSMDEIINLFPEDKPVLINFYDANTENEIKNDVFRAKTLLKDRCTVCSIKQQDYPELAKLWDAADKTPSMILFEDGKPKMRLYEETHYLEIVAKVGKYCRAAGEEHTDVA